MRKYCYDEKILPRNNQLLSFLTPHGSTCKQVFRVINHAIPKKITVSSMLSLSAARIVISCCDINSAEPLYEAEVFVRSKRLERKHSWRGCVRDRGGLASLLTSQLSPSWVWMMAAEGRGSCEFDAPQTPHGSELPQQPCPHCKDT